MALLILGIALVPSTVERLTSPDRVRVGTYWYTGDFSQYVAAMRDGSSSPSWLIQDHFSAEPHDPVFMYPLYVAIGKLSAATGIAIMAIYTASELLMRLTLPVALYVFLAVFLQNPGQRRFGFILATFSGGLVFWLGMGELFLLGDAGAGDMLPLRPIVVETLPFASFLAAPHIGFGVALTLLIVVCFALACRGVSHAWPLLFAATLALGLIHPFNLPVLPCVFLSYGILDTLIQRRLALRPLLASAVVVLVAVPFVTYNFATFAVAPFWKETYGSEQNLMLSWSPWQLPVGYGVVLLLAPFGVYRLGKNWGPEHRLLLVFLLVQLACMYLPVPYQRRFGLGLHPALAAFAALGWPLLLAGGFKLAARLKLPERKRSIVARRLVLYPLLIVGLGDWFYAYSQVVATAANRPAEISPYTDRATSEASNWIACHSSQDDVTAASLSSSTLLGGMVLGRVLAGHNVATVRFREKLDMIHKLYEGALTDDEARRFLSENRVSYVLVGPEERKLGDTDPGVQLHLPVSARIGDAIIYRFPSAEATTAR